MHNKFVGSCLFLSVLTLAILTGCDDDEPVSQNLCNGVADGTACGSAVTSACRDQDVCQGGQCVAVFVVAGTACGDATPSGICDQADACDGAGTCAENHLADGTACGNVGSSECDAADACVRGACATNTVAAGAPCGDSASTTCSAPDTCDGSGQCLAHNAVDGTACGDSTDTFCNPADTCLTGVCQTPVTLAGTACGSSVTSACDLPDTCDGAGACASNTIAAGTPCGVATVTQCNGADLCDGAGACATNEAADGVACYDCTAGLGDCNTCVAAVCDSRAVNVCSAATALTAATNGDNNQRGNMFDVIATNTVTIRSFDVSPRADTTIEIYYRAGTWNGFANSPSAWTFVGAAPVTFAAGLVPVAVAVDVTIPAGQTYAFYVTSNTTSVSVNYTNGTSVGNVYASDANLKFLEGGGMDYPFTLGTGAVYQPRVWNGVIHYDVAPSVDTAATAYAGATAAGVMFDIEALTKTGLDNLDVELVSGIADAKIYFRRGSFVGHDASAAGWEPIATILAADVATAGSGARSRFVFDDRVELNAGEIIGVYVDSTQADQLRTTSGGAVGDVAATSGTLTFYVGSALATSFGGAGSAATIRASAVAATCVVPPI